MMQILSTLIIIFFFVVFPNIVNAEKQPYPNPYVPVNEVFENEFHSLRPYQASPANIPLNTKEQALICGNDLIINDPIYVTPGSEDDLKTIKPCLKNPKCGYCELCEFESIRDFTMEFDSFGSELPIAGNTELIKGGDESLAQKIAGGIGFVDQWRLKGDALGGFDLHKPPEVSRYDDPRAYYEAYQEWRGRNCIHTPREVTLPIIGEIRLPSAMICYEDFRSPNFWANLFPKIPYSSTEDRIGKARVSKMYFVPEQSSVERIEPDPPNTIFSPHTPVYGDDLNIEQKTNEYGETPLYFPHMEENVELSALLQSTYIPKELATVSAAPGPNLEPSPAPNKNCKIINVRYNPGDQLFGEREKGFSGTGIPNADVEYHAFYFCQVCWDDPPPLGDCHPEYNCVNNAWFYSDVTIYTPLIDELFGRTVQSESSILRKVFPRTGEESPLETIEDIPTVTSVVHDSKDNISPSSPTQTVSAPAEYYIPHFGSIYDYFLHDMQTAIRPKGFPGRPAGLSKNYIIPEVDQLNEYISWYLNGTIYRAEQNELDDSSNCIGELTNRAGVCSIATAPCFQSLIPPVPGIVDGKANCGPLSMCCISATDIIFDKPVTELDTDKVVNKSGPINKLLSQHIQWNNIFQKARESFVKSDVARVPQTTPRAETNRHNQIVGCTIGKTISFLGINITIGGFPVMCPTKSQENLPGEQPPPNTGPVVPPGGGCPNVPDAEIGGLYLTLKPNFIDIANRLIPGENLAEECYNYVVRESQSARVNPGFSLAIWLHESGASNYDYRDGVLDLGMTNAPQENLIEQLQAFLNGCLGSQALSCGNNSTQNWPTLMHGFLCTYAYGKCDINYEETVNGQTQSCVPTNTKIDENYYYAIQTYFNWVTGCSSLINYPTDMICP